MKSLFDKIKSLDKKILIGAGAGIVLVIAIIVAVAIYFGSKPTSDEKDNTKVEENVDKDKENEEEQSKDESEDEVEATFLVKVVDTEGNPVSGVTLQLCKEACVPGKTDETGVATFNVEITDGYKLSVLTCPEGYEYTGEAEVALEAGITEYTVTIQKKAAENTGNPATQQPTVTKPDGTEILGAGSKNQPYLETPNLSNMTLTTVNIPAGKTLYYGIYRVGNMILTINDANAYVIESDGTRHNASGGKVSFTVENALASDYVLFQIGNNSGSAKSFTIKFSNPTGSYQNPTTATMSGNITVKLAEGDSDGHWYKYVAERTGKLRFYLLTAPNNNVLIATNNRNSAQRTIEADGVVDSQGTYIEMDVNQGDVILINVGAKPNQRGKYLATTITWFGKYS